MERCSDSPADLKHGDLTRDILACAMEVSNELGSGFLESVYERALGILLAEHGFFVDHQKPLPVLFRKHVIGTYYADLVVNECIVVELKATRAWVPEHEAQLIHYLTATGLEVGLLLNFGKPRLEYRRLVRYKDFATVKEEDT